VAKAFMGAFLQVWLVMFVWVIVAFICISPIKQHQLHVNLERK
jgi:hypothetical protein